MKVSNIFILVVSFFILHGVWQFIWIGVAKKGYAVFKKDNETFLDYCLREFNTLDWKLRKRLGISWFFNGRLFVIFTILKGLVLVCLGVSFIVLYFLIKGTEYGVWLDITL